MSQLQQDDSRDIDSTVAKHVVVTDPGPRVMIIGDVHGCFDEFRELLEKHHRRTDTLILVGDLVNKGPRSLQTIALARKYNALAVLGNHEIAMLRVWHSRRSGLESKNNLRDAWTDQLTSADISWLSGLPYTICLPTHNSIVVHAGLVPGISLIDQTAQDMTEMRNLETTDSGFRVMHSGEGHAWATSWTGPEHVYFGHDAKRRLQQTKFSTGLDTGCVYGGELTACILETGKQPRLVSVGAKKKYA